MIALDGDWKYSDDGTDQGDTWKDATFDDSAWQTGAAELGYGDDDEMTVLADTARPSAYFRKTITLDAEVVAAELRAGARADGEVLQAHRRLASPLDVR
ncbi:hypothetical protein D3C83_42790 [compost metagenome]